MLEFAEGGDLLKVIEKNKKQGTYLDESLVWSYFIQMLQGIQALHENQIVHWDLKAANVFLSKEGIIKIGDMNVSKVV